MSEQNNTTQRRRAPKRVREIDARPTQAMLEDHPFIVPVISLVLAGICVYVTILSNVARDLLLPANATRDVIAGFNNGISWAAAAAISIFFIAGIFLSLNTVSYALRARNRKPVICPQCNTQEQRRGQFARTRIKDTPWEEVTCPNCGNKWYNKV